jgi:hypothetical protein
MVVLTNLPMIKPHRFNTGIPKHAFGHNPRQFLSTYQPIFPKMAQPTITGLRSDRFQLGFPTKSSLILLTTCSSQRNKDVTNETLLRKLFVMQSHALYNRICKFPRPRYESMATRWANLLRRTQIECGPPCIQIAFTQLVNKFPAEPAPSWASWTQSTLSVLASPRYILIVSYICA